MKTPKRIYLPPTMAVREVELESPICGGSVKFGEADAKITIEQQDIVENVNNDFSDKTWTVDGTNTQNF